MRAAHGAIENLQRSTAGSELSGREGNRDVAEPARREPLEASILLNRKITRDGEIAHHDLRWPCVGDHDLFRIAGRADEYLGKHQRWRDGVGGTHTVAIDSNAHRVSAAIGQRL